MFESDGMGWKKGRRVEYILYDCKKYYYFEELPVVCTLVTMVPKPKKLSIFRNFLVNMLTFASMSSRVLRKVDKIIVSEVVCFDVTVIKKRHVPVVDIAASVPNFALSRLTTREDCNSTNTQLAIP